MKRILIFGVLGPTLGFLMATSIAAGFGIFPSDVHVLLIMFAYAFTTGMVPAVLAGAVDWYLASRLTFAQRVLTTAGAGYLLCVLVGLTLLQRSLSVVAALMFASVGMLAAAICSFLSGKQRA